MDNPSLFKQLEDGQNQANVRDKDLLAELSRRIKPSDTANLRRLWRAWCWRHDFSVAQEAIDYATTRLKDVPPEDLLTRSDLILCRASYLEARGELESALKEDELSVELARRAGATRILGDALTQRGQLRSYLGQTAGAVADLIESHRIYTSLGLNYWAMSNLLHIADSYRRTEDYERALEYYQQVINSSKDFDDIGLKSTAIGGMGRVYLSNNEFNKAEKMFLQSMEIDRTNREASEAIRQGNLSILRSGLATVYVERGEYDRALDMLKLAKTGLSEEQGRGLVSEIYLQEGRAWLGKREFAKSLLALDQAEKLLKEEKNPRLYARFLRVKAEILGKKGDFNHAYHTLEDYFEVRRVLDLEVREEATAHLKIEFETERRDAQNRQLLAEKTMKDQELQTLNQVQLYQRYIIMLGSLLLAILGGIGWQYLRDARRMQILAHTDELTGVANRRQIMAGAEQHFRRAREHREQLSLLMLDVDFFKQINDQFGHESGDQALISVAQTAQAALRHGDLLGRTGGEEFLVILPLADTRQAASVAERIRSIIARTPLKIGEEAHQVTISIGVASLEIDDHSVTDIVRRADHALYRAKNSGRNRIELASENPDIAL
ncbi:diguanylate cyclase [Burkholderiaceae bacterium DAT-1]|nr:diguanylate cyclase [Burkholderiaceae bacterium DAT-1]